MKQYTDHLAGLTVSRIAYGFASLVDWNGGAPSDTTVRELERLVLTAHDCGITLFDLADQYSFGKAEAAFGEVLKRSRGLRDKIVIQSKCGIVYGGAFSTSHFDCRKQHIIEAVDGSLERLGTDHLDILLLHYPDVLVQPMEVGSAFEVLKRAGKVRCFGVSNHSPSQIELLKKGVSERLAVNQIYMSLALSRLLAGSLGILWGGASHTYEYAQLPATLDYCRLNDIQVQAYSPLLRGLLLNSAGSCSPELQNARQVIGEVAVQKGVAPSAIALAWLLHHPAHVIPIIGTSKAEHVVENCAAVEVSLTQEEWYRLLRATVSLQW